MSSRKDPAERKDGLIVYITQAERDALCELTRLSGRSMSQEARQAIRRYIGADWVTAGTSGANIIYSSGWKPFHAASDEGGSSE